jgi:Chaperone of endosialidase
MQTIHNNLPLGNSISRSPVRRGSVLIALALACFALSATAHAQRLSPAPDGGYRNQNTAEGKDALFSLTTGADNTAIGFNALHSLTTGSEATATGSLALFNDTTGFNTAYGFKALYSNTDGFANVAIGRNAMRDHTTGDHNTATGGAALIFNTDGTGNTATGRAAMGFGATGSQNTATGWQALFNNTGDNNTSNGAFALYSNTTGGGNIALGFNAGTNLTTGDNNIDIGNEGVADEANTIRIGASGDQTRTFIAGISGTAVTGVAVRVSSSGQLGTAPSSKRFKDEIKPMDKASEAILALKPVSFRYKHKVDPEGTPQFGLIAEEVAKVNPDLVARDTHGEIYTVRYEAVNAMLLNEFLKEHRKVQEQETTIAQLKNGMERLATHLKEQDSKIEKVSAQIEASKPAPQMVSNNQ